MKEQNYKKLELLLEETLGYLKKSQNSEWASQDINIVCKTIKKEIKNLKQGRKINKKQLMLEFLPTSSIQEIFVTNNLSKQYLDISSRFDKVIKQI